MTPDEFRTALKTLGTTQRAFAKDIDVTPNTVSRYALGRLAVPTLLAKYLQLLCDLRAEEEATTQTFLSETLKAEILSGKVSIDDGIVRIKAT